MTMILCIIINPLLSSNSTRFLFVFRYRELKELTSQRRYLPHETSGIYIQKLIINSSYISEYFPIVAILFTDKKYVFHFDVSISCKSFPHYLLLGYFRLILNTHTPYIYYIS